MSKYVLKPAFCRIHNGQIIAFFLDQNGILYVEKENFLAIFQEKEQKLINLKLKMILKKSPSFFVTQINKEFLSEYVIISSITSTFFINKIKELADFFSNIIIEYRKIFCSEADFQYRTEHERSYFSKATGIPDFILSEMLRTNRR